MKNIFFIVLVTSGFLGFTQGSDDKDKSELYKNYREDQFYISVTYNLLSQKPSGVNQSGFSTGFHFGFIRDMPINKKRTVALGIGLGLSTNSYNQNMAITEVNNQIEFNIINESEINVSKNKFTTYLLEVPFELRWRKSSPTTYNFLRIYPGFKFGYLFYNSSKLKSSDGDVKLSNIDSFNRLQYGFTLSAGYGTWNVHAYYGLNAIFGDSTKLDGAALDMSSFKIGLMFYIL
ncbi:porin family protein [Winogradskyella aquimaris]|uniref:Porin family protein n=1 Tax=Winogradskyella aquimaris TaxID=864074 RepID=A0ABU5EKC2_9FLAO|nr:porin family protein [Winogradskyella aquimaris]MDY2585918.1 porin family protein [Winogradskyella aquimaris]